MTALRPKKLAEQLRVLRLARGYSKARHFARELGISENRYTRYERGEAEPDVELMRTICEKLDASPNELFGWAGGGVPAGYAQNSNSVAAAMGFAESDAPVPGPDDVRAAEAEPGADVPRASPTQELAAWRLASAFGAAGISVAKSSGADERLSTLQATADIFLRLREEPLATVAQLLQRLDVSILERDRQAALSAEIETFVRDLRGAD